LNSLWKNKVSASRDVLIEAGDKLTEGWRAQTAAVKADCKIIETRLNIVRDEIRARVEAFAAIEKSRIAAHEAAIAAIAEHPQWGLTETSEEIALRLERLKNYPPRDWQEFRERASTILANEIDRTADLLAKAQRREAEAIELARLRAEEIERQRIAALDAQRVREEQIAQAAAEAARREAEAKAAREAAERERSAQAAREAEERAAARKVADAERARKDAEELAENLKRQAADAAVRAQEAAQRAAAKAEADRIAAEQRAAKALADQLEAERKRVADERAREEAAAQARAANVAHKKRINGEILVDVIAAMADVHSGNVEEAEKIGKALIAAMARGQVRHVKVEY
jgi:hypothetical protein